MKTTTRNTTCDHCHKPFPIAIKTTRITGSGERWSFTCPHCYHTYTVATITPHGVELRRQIESLKAQLRLAPLNTDLIERRDQLQADLRTQVNGTLLEG